MPSGATHRNDWPKTSPPTGSNTTSAPRPPVSSRTVFPKGASPGIIDSLVGTELLRRCNLLIASSRGKHSGSQCAPDLDGGETARTGRAMHQQGFARLQIWRAISKPA